MPGRSSADPDDLDAWVAANRGLDSGLAPHHGNFVRFQNTFSSNTVDGGFDASSLIRAFRTYLDENEKDSQWTSFIAGVFRQADSSGGVVGLPDSVIAAGLRAAGLSGGRQSVTFDDPIVWGAPPTSGYANDPVNTASGNFVEIETDLEFGGLLGALRFSRTYNSRSDRVGPFGVGWASWASARLRAAPDGAHWEGPDGQRAVVPVVGDGSRYRRVVGIQGLVVPGESGLALEWFGGRRWEFDAEGLLVAAQDGPGTRVRFEYADNMLVALVHEGGTRLDVCWDGERIVALRCSDGRRVAYRYDGAANLVEVEGPGGRRRYELDAAGRVLAVLDADGVAEVRNSYDADGRVLEQVSPHGRRTRMRYLPGHVTIVDDLDGGPVNTYLHDRQGRLVGVIDGHGAELTKEYDVWGNPTVITDRLGAVTLQEWDGRARLTRRVLPSGAGFTFSYDGHDRVVEVAASTGGSIRCRYVGAERVPAEVVDQEGGVTRLEVADGLVGGFVDPDGIEVRFGHDAFGHISSVTDAHGHTATVERDDTGRAIATVSPTGGRTELTYDPAGRVVERRDPGGAVWRFGYTPAGRLSSVTDPTGARTEARYGDNGEAEQIVDPLGHVTLCRFDTLGNLAGMVAPDGAKWELGYDALCRLVGVQDPAGSSWLREHDPDGNLTASIDPLGARRTATVDRLGRVTRTDDGATSVEFEHDELGRVLVQRRADGTEFRTTYDRRGRRVAVTDPLGGVTRYAYTAAGRLARVTSPLGHVVTMEYDRVGQLVAEVDPRGRRREYRYDADGRIIRMTAGGQAWYYGYDEAGRLASHREPHGGQTRYGYDPAGRLTEVSDPTGGVTRFGYDPRGALVEAVDANGAVTRYTRNARGWVTGVTDPLGGVVQHRHDEVGRPVASTDQLGRTTRWNYDQAGRLSRRIDAVGKQVRWSYDPSGRLAGYQAGDADPVTVERDALARVVAVDEPGRRHRLAWDPLDRLVAKRSGGLELTWAYDADDRQVAAGNADGTETSFGHDEAGGMVWAEHPLLGSIRLRRDETGRLVALEVGGRSESWTYRDGQLVGHRLERDGRRRETELERDEAGRVVTEIRDGVTTRYGYNTAGQLTSAEGPEGARTYGYDAAGRLITETGPAGTTTYAYDEAGQLRQRCLGAELTEYDYDAAGHRITETSHKLTRTFTWSPRSDLTGIHRHGPAEESSTTLSVDAFGDLAAIDDTELIWDPTGIIPELRRLGETTVIGSDGQRWATTDPTGGVSWLDTDWQHSTGGPRDPWGGTDGPGAAGLGWRGELHVDGLTWLRNRAYDPNTRSFLAPDPLPPVPGTPVAANPYHYANNDPLNLLDPLGLRPMTDADLQAYRQAHQGISLSDLAHGALDVVGMIPVVGEVADLANAGLYLAEGDYTNAALSAAAMIPIIGGAAIAAKYANKAHKAMNAVDATRVYRVEGAGNARLDISPGGDVAIKGDNMLFLNFGDKARAEEFLTKRHEQGFDDTVIKSFDVPTSYVDSLRSSAVPESMASTGRPIVVDVNKASDQFGLRSHHFPELSRNIVPGSGRAH